MENNRLENFVSAAISHCNELMRAKTCKYGKPMRARNAMVKIRQAIAANHDGGHRWIIIPGLRGTGKTTLLAQSYDYIQQVYPNANIIYFSVDNAIAAGFNMHDIIDEYLRQVGGDTTLGDNTYLLLDEVQSDNNWAQTLKGYYDMLPKLFMICSGSSAAHLQINADIAGRRADIICLYPMTFCEFELIANNIYPETNLGQYLSSALFNSKTAQECFDRLSVVTDKIDGYLTKINTSDWTTYLAKGSLPFTIDSHNLGEAYEKVLLTIDKVASKDLVHIGNIETKTVGIAQSLIRLLADADTISVNDIANTLNTSNATIASILDGLCKAELLIRVIPYGSNFTAARKNNKYLFTSSVIRASLNYLNGSPFGDEEKEGRLLEDIVGLYLYKRNGVLNLGNIFYDSAEGGADFIVKAGMGNESVVIETGRGRKTARQVDTTYNRVPSSKYGITICNTDNIQLASNGQSVFIPWRVFALAG